MKRKNRIMFGIIYALFLFIAWNVTETSTSFTDTKTYKGEMTADEEGYVEPTEETTTKKDKALSKDIERDNIEKQPSDPKTKKSTSPKREESPDTETEDTPDENGKETSESATEK